MKSINELNQNEKFDKQYLKNRITGWDNEELKSNEPKAQNDTGLEKYIWRMAVFYSGRNLSIPVTYSWKLQNWIDENISEDISVTSILEEKDKKFLREVDKMAIELLDELNISSNKASLEYNNKLF